MASYDIEAPPPVSQDGSGSSHASHIEVCVRLRPLTVADESSSGFFKDQPQESSIPNPSRNGRHSLVHMRKPHIPRPFKKMITTTTKKPDAKHDPMMYAWDIVSDDTMVQSPKTDIILGRTHSYTLDRVYGPTVSNQQLYDKSIKSLVHAAMDGYHTSVLAYGQTSTGKTFTMSGTPSNPGMIPLCVKECFDYLQAQVDPREYMLRVSYLEVYKEHIRDLLATSATPIRLFEANGELIIKGLEEKIVTSPAEVFQVLAQGEARRQTGATNLNQHSSRSHTLVRMWIESKHAENDKGKGVRISSLSLVDLAGSESVKLTGSTERQQEGHFINQSLMTLGKIVYQLSEIEENSSNGKKPHIPYRDSKLTRLLQPSLSGNARIALICCVSPLVSHIEESHNTFKFATRAKKIPQKATIQESLDEKTLLQSYKEEIEELKRQLREAQEQQAAIKATMSSHSASTASMTSLSDVDEDEIQELVKSIQTMERLILRSSPNGNTPTFKRPEDLLDGSDMELAWDKDDDDGLMALLDDSAVSTPQRKPMAVDTSEAAFEPDVVLHNELRRVQGLLGSVLKKKRELGRTKSTDEDDEVRNLRLQLEQQEVTTNLSKADSSFLQRQLAEKDSLLHEVYKVLEQVEQRQTALEAENAALKAEVARLRNGGDTS